MRQLIELPGQKLIDVPDVVQQDNYTCWCCSCLGVGRLWGVGPRDVDGWKRLLGTTRKDPGRPAKVYDAFKKFDCQVAMGEGMTIDDLKDFFYKGWPVITPIQEYMSGKEKARGTFGHCVTVIGVGLGMVFIQDPSEDNVVRPQKNDSDNAPGRAMIEEKKWNDVWHDREYKHCGIAIGPPPTRRTFGDRS